MEKGLNRIILQSQWRRCVLRCWQGKKVGTLRAKGRLRFWVAVPVTCSCGADFLAVPRSCSPAPPLWHNPRLGSRFQLCWRGRRVALAKELNAAQSCRVAAADCSGHALWVTLLCVMQRLLPASFSCQNIQIGRIWFGYCGYYAIGYLQRLSC